MENRRVKIAPSIFAADFYNLQKAIDTIEKSGAEYIHYDVMDNHFVPNISFGPKMVSDLMKKTSLKSDVHLMIDLDNRDSLQTYIDIGVSHITLHIESTTQNVTELLKRIKDKGITAGLSIKPKTSVEAIAPYLDILDLILVMSVEPGFSGQSFMADSLSKLNTLHKMTANRNISIQIDGGISRGNYKSVLENGADFLVIGSAFFSDDNPNEWVETAKKLKQ